MNPAELNIELATNVAMRFLGRGANQKNSVQIGSIGLLKSIHNDTRELVGVIDRMYDKSKKKAESPLDKSSLSFVSGHCAPPVVLSWLNRRKERKQPWKQTEKL